MLAEQLCSILTTIVVHGHQILMESLNYEGVHFLRRLNAIIKNEHPDVMMIAKKALVKRSQVLKKEGGLGTAINGIWVG